MILRERRLPPGWYPQNSQGIRNFLSLNAPKNRSASQALAAVAPHAGWFYSGVIAAAAVAALNSHADTVAVIGGHLPAGMPALFAQEDGVKTPLGNMMIDGELREKLLSELDGRDDRWVDNTVEVLLPMVHYFFPQAKLLWVRLPAELSSFDAGALIARTGAAFNRKLVVLGSTDLTHYGDNYDFSPQGRGRRAYDWVRNVNDAAFIKAVTAGEPQAVLERAETDRSACSAGAVLGVLGFAHAGGLAGAECLAYATSAGDTAEGESLPDSFVGYAALAWYK
jgi:AmmeMemoRadiSam system protein B